MTATNNDKATVSGKQTLAGKGSAVSTQEVAAKPSRRRNFRIMVYEAWCKKCGICVAFCPAGALREHETTQQVLTTDAKCTGCRLCEWRCPDFAIVIKSIAAQQSDGLISGKKVGSKE